jgi:hypothetical protein
MLGVDGCWIQIGSASSSVISVTANGTCLHHVTLPPGSDAPKAAITHPGYMIERSSPFKKSTPMRLSRPGLCPGCARPWFLLVWPGTWDNTASTNWLDVFSCDVSKMCEGRQIR